MNDIDSIEDGAAIKNCDMNRFQHYQSSIFETPPSILASPQFSSNLFSSPMRSRLTCQVCRCDVNSLRSPCSSTCSHKLCDGCASSCQECPLCVDGTRNELTQLRLTSPSQLTDPVSESSASKNNLPRLDSYSIWGSSATVWDSKQSLPLESSNSLDERTSVETATLLASAQPPQQSRTQQLRPLVPPLCAACGEDHEATHFCVDCKDLLCSTCVDAHQRVRITRDHSVLPLSQLATVRTPARPPPGVEEPPVLTGCALHEGARLICVCESCKQLPVCTRCLPDHSRHHITPLGDLKSTIMSLVADSRAEEKAADETLETLQRMMERVDASVQAVASELRSCVHMHVSALEERKRELLQRLDTIRVSKKATLKAQSEALAIKKGHLAQMRFPHDFIKDEQDQAKLASVLEALLAVYSAPRIPTEAHESDSIKFTIPEQTLLGKLRGLGGLESGACARSSQILGEGFRRAIRDRVTTIHVQLRDACNEPCKGQGQPLAAILLTPTGCPVDIQLADRDQGVYALTYTPTMDGIHTLNVTVRGVPILGCPAQVEVRRGRNYEELAVNGELFSFGREGSGDGELCRPWGICCDLLGRILVADRSNNRIQIFDKEGNFLSKFGGSGTRSGLFDRPAGITTNTLNQIIVADKDNHRIQVFDENGNFVLKFGERGRPVGMFNYPWGVATNSLNHIAVSDTRNHRVQIFTSMGQFIRKCGFDSAFYYKHLDSPRGLCYLPDGRLLITDFNNHRLAVLSASRASPEMKCYGSEGEADGLFCRPQGVKTDVEGHILICDSRNNRVQIFNADDMRCVGSFGGSRHCNNGFQMPAELPTPMAVAGGAGQSPAPLFPLSGPSTPSSLPVPRTLLDRPTDLCVTPDGRIYVVDFGNNCIRVF